MRLENTINNITFTRGKTQVWKIKEKKKNACNKEDQLILQTEDPITKLQDLNVRHQNI